MGSYTFIFLIPICYRKYFIQNYNYDFPVLRVVLRILHFANKIAHYLKLKLFTSPSQPMAYWMGEKS